MQNDLFQSQFLFKSSAGQNKSNLGWSPLHLAAYFGHEKVAEALLTVSAENG